MSENTGVPTIPDNFTIMNPVFINDPFKDYDWMLHRPVWRDPVTNFWVVTRYDDVRAIATDHATWSNQTSQILNRTSSVSKQVKEIYETHGWLPMDTVITNDPPKHKLYRSLIDKAFAPGRVKAIVPFIEARVDQLMNLMFENNEFDFMRVFAMPLTISVLADQVGEAGPEDFERIRHWADIQLELINPILLPARELEITYEVVKFQHFVAEAVERVRKYPNDKILSALVHADIDGRKLSVREVIQISAQFFVAGHDTTSAALGSAMLYLAQHPETLELLKNRPEKIPNFIEEILRLEAPVQRLFRRATRPTKIGETEVHENDIAVIQWGGGNRDSLRFECPYTMDVDRSNSSRNLTFGAGIHFCVGNQLARAQLLVALVAITQRCASIALPNGKNSYEYSPLFISRSLTRLDIVATPV